MDDKQIGIWLIGAWGGVSTTVACGLSALQKGLVGETGLVTALPRFADIGLAGWDRFVIGGHEIRRTAYAVEAKALHDNSRVFDNQLLAGIDETLGAFDHNVRTGTLLGVGKMIESLASAEAKKMAGEKPAAAIERLSHDLNEFRKQHHLADIVVVNVSSTEPAPEIADIPKRWADLSKKLDSAKTSPIPASSLYAVAAMQSKCAYVNFTPSLGSNLPALNELALEQGVLHMGCDGKTGETLMKSILAPMFATRNLEVMSWVGHNIFGNLDGKVLDDPQNKASKVYSKDHLLTDILGYQPQTLVSIEHIASMGDWKTAWDHIHFKGFLNTPMTMQFTWQGCDSLLAAPLVLDLVRLTQREQRRGKSGLMPHLSSFFKSPAGTDVSQFHQQYDLLVSWAENLAEEGKS